MLAGLGACLVALISCLRLFEFSTGKSFDVDSWFLQVPTDRLGLAPLGKMASFTAVGFFGRGAFAGDAHLGQERGGL